MASSKSELKRIVNSLTYKELEGFRSIATDLHPKASLIYTQMRAADGDIRKAVIMAINMANNLDDLKGLSQIIYSIKPGLSLQELSYDALSPSKKTIADSMGLKPTRGGRRRRSRSHRRSHRRSRR